MPSMLITNATHFASDTDSNLRTSDILVDGGTIARIEPTLPREGVSELFDASGMLVIPGMIDTHAHMWESLFRGYLFDAWGMEYFSNLVPLGGLLTPQDIYEGTYAGALELLNCGVTTVLDYAHGILSPEHADAGIRALADAGIRARFSYDLLGRDPHGTATLAPSSARFEDLIRVRSLIENLDNDRLDLGVSLSPVEPSTFDLTVTEIEFARSLGLPMTFHHRLGGEISLMERHGILDRDILPAHSNSATNEDLDALARCGGSLSTQPEAECYGGRRAYSMVRRAHTRGVKLALGTDVTGALAEPSIMSQMRLLYYLHRYLDGAHERAEGHVPVARRPGWPLLGSREIFEFGTNLGAAAMGLDQRTGAIRTGLAADLAFVDVSTFGLGAGHPAGHIVLSATSGDVDSVMVAGEFRKRSRRLVDVDVDVFRQRFDSARDRVLAHADAPRMTPTSSPWVTALD